MKYLTITSRNKTCECGKRATCIAVDAANAKHYLCDKCLLEVTGTYLIKNAKEKQ